MKRLFIVLFFSLVVFVAIAQPNFTIVCTVNESQSVSLYRDEPLMLTVTLTNEVLQKNLKWNRAADDWLMELEKQLTEGKITNEEFEEEKMLVKEGRKPLKKDTMGSTAQPWYLMLDFQVIKNDKQVNESWKFELLGMPSDAVAVLDENAYFLQRFHLPPEKLELVKPGQYRLGVVLDKVLSNVVEVNIQNRKMPPGIKNSTEKQLQFAYYYWLAQNAEKTLLHASSVLKKNPLHIQALMLRGEGYILKGNYREALRDFEKALKQHERKSSRLTEPPDYLYFRISWLKERL